jgi:hypothetical protein
VNSSARDAARVRLEVASKGARPPSGAARIFRIDGPGVEAINVPGKEPAVTLRELEPVAISYPLGIDLPAHSVTLVLLGGEK